MTRKNSTLYILDFFIILMMCTLLFYGAAWQFFAPFTDVARYECYAVGFWHGQAATGSLQPTQCDFLHDPTTPVPTQADIAKAMQNYGFPEPLISFVGAQTPEEPFHLLPREYPIFNLIFFSLSLLTAPGWYQVAFAVIMALFATAMYAILVKFWSRGAAVACALYLVIGGWTTAVGRFDLIPAFLSLGALVCATRKSWNWAFALLALAAMSKLYPFILFIPFLLAQQLEAEGNWFARRRWLPTGVFIGVCALIAGISSLFSVAGTLAPLSYLGDRPIQIESFLASLLWLGSLLTQEQLQFAYTFGSVNVLSSLSSPISLLGTVLLGAGLLYTFWLQWRGRISLTVSCLLTLLVVILTGKIFSPQYLIWLAPLVAYVGKGNLKWLLPWSLISLLTTLVYPYIYLMILDTPLTNVPRLPIFFPVSTLRNLLLCSFILALFWWFSSSRTLNQRLKGKYPIPSLPPEPPLRTPPVTSALSDKSPVQKGESNASQ